VTEPAASQPFWPDYPQKDVKLLPWSWALERLSSSRNYFISTVRPDGGPHTAILWAVWLDGALYFSTGLRSRKARNLEHQPRCTITTDRGEDAAILEGVASRCAMPAGLPAAYKAKYDWPIKADDGSWFVVRPRVVFAFREHDMAESTRWTFPAPA
jgi:hypothetical protein